ncbi:MAG: hypothetical protein KME59_09895 [Trichormus sp. ATA11-4-KO1]|nr:hypothetical protein [Trichormus sp. ATA11-4-KO1]
MADTLKFSASGSQSSTAYPDKGFISADWQAMIARHTGNRIWTLKRENQHLQHSHTLNRFR